MRVKLMMAVVLALFSAGQGLAKDKHKKVDPAPVYTPTPAPTPDNLFHLELSNGGQIVVQLRPDKAPQSVDRIKTLTRQGFYNGLVFHRVIEGFMAQGGDPKGDGSGGSSLPDLPAEFNDMPHVRGTMSMARAADPNSANSQFFLMLMPNLGLDGHYSPVGRVVSGMAAVDKIEKGEPPVNPTRIVKAWIEADGRDAPLLPAAAPAQLPQDETVTAPPPEAETAPAVEVAPNAEVMPELAPAPEAVPEAVPAQ